MTQIFIPRRRRLFVLLAASVVASLLLFVLASAAFAKPSPVEQVSLRTLEAASASDVEPLMYFEPDFFAPGAATYLSDGADYSLQGRGVNAPGRGPHGGYDTTSSKCGVCHSAHAAQGSDDGITDNHLTRVGSTGCEYCHLQGSVISAGKSSKIVYTQASATPGSSDIEVSGGSGHAITGIPTEIPASQKPGGGGPVEDFVLTCASCHIVHGSSSAAWRPDDFWKDSNANVLSPEQFGYKLLRNNPSGFGTPVPDSGSGAPETAVTAVNQYTMGVWCANCHNQALSPQTQASQIETFTATDAGSASDAIHTSADLASEPMVSGAHASVLTGIYAGPGQCYTCHRGDLSAEPEAVGVYGSDGSDAIAAIPGTSYLPISAAATTPSAKEAEYENNKLCSRCHFGTVDYALSAPNSDWPHSSGKDVALLGAWKASDAKPDATITAVDDMAPLNTRSYVCSRCHVSLDAAANTYAISYHGKAHSFNFLKALETIGSLEATYSPGY